LTATAGTPDAFGLKAGEGGGGDCVSDCGTGEAGDAGPYYETVVQGMVRDAIERNDRLRYARYRATVSFIFDSAGHVTSVSFQSFEGDTDVKAEIIKTLKQMAASENIPADMENGKPWVVRVAARAPS
jgi:hypothetical protein